MLPQAF